MTETFFLGVGGNVGDAVETCSSAVQYLRREGALSDVCASRLYCTRPVGPADQSHFINLVVRGGTSLSPLELLQLCQKLEARFGRQHTTRWGPRTLDVDLLFMESRIFDHADLILPHPQIPRRGFVLEPFCDLAPTFVHPILQTSMAQLRDAWRISVDNPSDWVAPLWDFEQLATSC